MSLFRYNPCWKNQTQKIFSSFGISFRGGELRVEVVKVY